MKQPKKPTISEELRILKNYIRKMPKTYRKYNFNWVIVQDLIMTGTSTAGKTSCIEECNRPGIDPFGYDLKQYKEV